jgi:hypothetical protein
MAQMSESDRVFNKIEYSDVTGVDSMFRTNDRGFQSSGHTGLHKEYRLERTWVTPDHSGRQPTVAAC